MGPESLFKPPEPSHSTGAKRLGALSSIGCETKRLCTQPSELPFGNAASELNNGLDWWGGFGITSNSNFDNALSQYGINPGTEWRNTGAPGNLGSDSTPIPPGAEAGPCLSNEMPAQLHEMNTQSYPGANELYHQPEHQESTNTFDLQYSLDASKAIGPTLELSHGIDFGYTSNFSENWLLPDQSFYPFTPLIDGTPKRIDATTTPQKGSEPQPLAFFDFHQPASIEIASKGKETPFATLEETEPVGGRGASACFSTVMSLNNDLPGKLRRKHVLILVI